MFMLCTSNTSVDLRRLAHDVWAAHACAVFVDAESIGETKPGSRIQTVYTTLYTRLPGPNELRVASASYYIMYCRLSPPAGPAPALY